MTVPWGPPRPARPVGGNSGVCGVSSSAPPSTSVKSETSSRHSVTTPRGPTKTPSKRPDVSVQPRPGHRKPEAAEVAAALEPTARGDAASLGRATPLLQASFRLEVHLDGDGRAARIKVPSPGDVKGSVRSGLGRSSAPGARAGAPASPPPSGPRACVPAALGTAHLRPCRPRDPAHLRPRRTRRSRSTRLLPTRAQPPVS